ncbi:hypothetical protein ACFOYW_17345 [Gryllotalpicola reticulitermitis]|uniref:Uncharacterized protein n=1 Tax=Gryllotalpicola reticulitermitis TaxID=1184153 RepID=A0ABV8QCG9_9MICO
MSEGTPLLTTTLEIARAAAGLLCATQADTDPVVRRGTKIAGARHIVQAALTIAAPELRTLGLLTDGLHAASMLVVAASPRYRRPALSQAVLAAAFAGAELWTVRHHAAQHTRKRRCRRP